MREGLRYRQIGRDYEQRESWKRAIEAYELALEADRKARKDIDAALCNRLGDLYRRIGDVNKAVYYYEKAADGHLAAGFYNNAIALCNKILRNQPNRHSAYLKLGKIGAAKGFLSDARRHFLEYAERMQRTKKLDEAFSALIEFANISSDPEIRLMIADQLFEHQRNAAAVEELRLAWRDMRQLGRDRDAEEVRDRIRQVAPERDPEIDPPEESTVVSSDVEGVVELPEILPFDEPETRAASEPEPKIDRYESGAADSKGARRARPAATEAVGAASVEDVEKEAPEHDGFDSEGEDEFLDIVPTTIEDPDRQAELTGEVPSLDSDFEMIPTNLPGAEAAATENESTGYADELDIVPTSVPGASSAGDIQKDLASGRDDDLAIVATLFEDVDAALEAEEEETEGNEGLNLEPTAFVDSGPYDESGSSGLASAETPADYESDAWRDELEAAMVLPPETAEEEEPFVRPADRIRELETRLEATPDDPETLATLAEALLEIGDRDRASRHLREAAELYEAVGRYDDSRRVVEELVRLDVNDVRAYQKRVELALMAKDREGLISAYLDLADCLDRTDATAKARIVAARVLEIDPANRRARQALELFESDQQKAAPPVAKSAGPSVEPGDYVDLHSLVVEEREAEAKSTRFRIPAADPKSEADVNFAEMLKQFKSMVSETIEKEDSSSHYDLGCAYRDMGLIDEAIAEFQIAARNPEYRLRAIEMLGACFAEKGEHRIAVKVLSRAFQVPGYKDEDLIEVFYAMGRAHEELGERLQAVECYERVMGCDVRFKDASRRATALRQ